MSLRFAPTTQAIIGRDGRVDPHWERWFGELARAVNSASTAAPEVTPADPVAIVQGYGISVTGAGTTDSPWVVRLREIADSGEGTFKLITRDTYGRLAGTEDGTAADVPYVNTTSGLDAEDVQEAIDELAAEKLDDAPSDGSTYGRKDGAWEPVASGGMTLIATAEITGAASASLTFSSLDLAADGKYVIDFRIKNDTASNNDVSIQYNGDTTAANYYNQRVTYNNASAGAARSTGGLIASMGNAEECAGTCEVVRNVSGSARAQSNMSRGATTSLIAQMFWVDWNTAANVTAIVLSGSQNFAIGSKARLFKLSG